MAYEKVRPFGEEWNDYRSAVQTAWVRSAWLEAGTEENPKDLMPKYDAGPEQKSEAQQIVDRILETL